MGDVLTAMQLRRLTEHKYSSEGCSLTEPVMQVFWCWLVEQIPRSWAPNAITLTGLLINIVSTMILVYYSPDAQTEVPWWPPFLCCVGLFVYQSLDAIDGKQARRTGSQSPLGELFDHGCDSVSVVFVALGTSAALGLGDTPSWYFYECFIAMTIFYCAHWQTYVTGTLKFARFDITEIQFGCMAVFTICSISGYDVWNYTLPLIGIRFKITLLLSSLLLHVYQMMNYFDVIFMEGGSGKNGSTIAGTSVLSPVTPIAIFLSLGVMIWLKSVTSVFEMNPAVYILTFGFVSAKITNKLVVAHMTKSEMAMLDSSFIGPGMLFFNQYFNTPISEHFLLYLCFLYCLLDLLWYSTYVCSEICDYLNIYCFKIKEQRRSSKENGGSNNGSHPSHSSQPASTSKTDSPPYSSPVTRSKTRTLSETNVDKTD